MHMTGNRGYNVRRTSREGTTGIPERAALFLGGWRLQVSPSFSCWRPVARTLSPESRKLIIMKRINSPLQGWPVSSHTVWR